MRILIPALVTFIPGSLLTTATLDLSAGEVISGSSRLVAGTMQLVLLSFGIAVGALIATPVAAWVATRPSGPPSLASFLPAFWLLVPGAVG